MTLSWGKNYRRRNPSDPDAFPSRSSGHPCETNLPVIGITFIREPCHRLFRGHYSPFIAPTDLCAALLHFDSSPREKSLCRLLLAPANGLKWKGWHAYRRGLATKLHELGIPDKVIQAILRHEDVKTTQRSYIKTLPSMVTEAMKRLEAKIACAADVQQVSVN